MSDQIPYLSDEELQKLMTDAEKENEIKAPDDLEDKVIARIVSIERKKTISFAGYCARVGFGVAAAIALLCIAPFASGSRMTEGGGTISVVEITEPAAHDTFFAREIPTKDEVLKGKEVRTKEEVLNSLKQPSPYEQLRSYFE